MHFEVQFNTDLLTLEEKY